MINTKKKKTLWQEVLTIFYKGVWEAEDGAWPAEGDRGKINQLIEGPLGTSSDWSECTRGKECYPSAGTKPSMGLGGLLGGALPKGGPPGKWGRRKCTDRGNPQRGSPEKQGRRH